MTEARALRGDCATGGPERQGYARNPADRMNPGFMPAGSREEDRKDGRKRFRSPFEAPCPGFSGFWFHNISYANGFGGIGGGVRVSFGHCARHGSDTVFERDSGEHP